MDELTQVGFLSLGAVGVVLVLSALTLWALVRLGARSESKEEPRPELVGAWARKAGEPPKTVCPCCGVVGRASVHYSAWDAQLRAKCGSCRGRYALPGPRPLQEGWST